MIAWSLSLLGACSIDLSSYPIWWSCGLLLIRTFLHTGLFITAHDAMHGSICLDRPHWNRSIGIACTTLYALLPYQTLLTKHHLHHQHPATEQDPDFADSSAGAKGDQGFWRWYIKFMGGYIDRTQALKLLLGMGAMFSIAHYILQVSMLNLLLLWVLPILFSSLQLFYFGTYLPHRPELSISSSKTFIRSSNLHPFWSLLTCYHFGYHWEHHEYPHTPWYRLPSLKKM